MAILPDDAGLILLPIARTAIERAVGKRVASKNYDQDWLHEKSASFVTLHKHRELRGCIGTVEAFRILIDDVKENAFGAAMRDPRFTSLRLEEVDEVDVEVSVLSHTEIIAFKDEADALSQMRVGIDGIVIEWNGYRSTFLPQVWESLRDPREFMAHLKTKAGLRADFWADDLNLYRYTVSKWSELDTH